MCEHTEHTLGVSTQLTTGKGCLYMYYLLYNSIRVSYFGDVCLYRQLPAKYNYFTVIGFLCSNTYPYFIQRYQIKMQGSFSYQCIKL